MSDDPDTATQQTVQEMCRQIHQAAKDPLVRQVALNAALRFRGGPAYIGRGVALTDVRMRADSCYWWCKHYLRFKHHGSMFEAWSSDLGDPSTKLQLLIAPDVLVRMSRMEGDCAIYTMMLCTLLEALGLRWDIVTAAVNRMEPEIFGHVWPRVILEGGARESLDASHGKYPGWQVPRQDLHRVWIFDQNGTRVAGDDGTRSRFSGLHAYRRRPGMGDVCNPSDPDYDYAFCGSQGAPSDYGVIPTIAPTGVFASYADISALTPAAGQYLTPSGSAYSGSVVQAPSQTSAQWANFASALLKSGLTLAEINSIQPGTVVGANGQILRQNPGYAVGTPTMAGNLGISTTTLMVGGLLLLGAVFMFSGKGR